MEASDTELARAVSRGSRDAAALLFERNWGEARRLAHSVCGREAMADDIAQEAMVQAFTSIRSFRGDGPFGAWLRRIVVTRALNAMRAERRLVALDAAGDPGAEDQPHIPDQSLRDAIARLPRDQRIAVGLRYGADLTPAEIADATGVAVGTVHSRLARALTQLRTTLEVADV
jgi:RNA polymerase sigma-70 factor, ECF subfamily